MRNPSKRLSIEPLESRWTPAVGTGEFLSAAATTIAGAAFFQAVSKDPGWMFNSEFKPFLTEKLQQIFAGARAASATFETLQRQNGQNPVLAGLEGIAGLDQALAQNVGAMIGATIAAPLSAPAAPPAPTPTDAGMTNTMPSSTDPHWIAHGTQGLKVWDMVTGSGTPVAAGNTISVFYTGWLASNGTVFDSRRSPAAPATFALSGLIQGWQQGIPGMKPGGIRRLYIPAALGYGATGSPPKVPANADLIFEIKLISAHP